MSPTRAQGPEARLTHERLQRLQAMTSALSVGLTQEQIGEIVLQRGLDLMGFSAASLTLVQPDGELEVIAHRGFRPGLVEAFVRMSPDARTPLADAARTRNPVFIGSRAAFEAAYPEMTAQMRLGHNHAWAAVPMLWEDRTLGCLGLSFAQPRGFVSDEREFLLAIAQQCALALMRISHFSIRQLLTEMTPDELLELRRAIDARLRE